MKKKSVKKQNKKKRKKFNLREQYSKSWRYIKKSGKFIWIAVGVFFIFALIGFFIPPPESFSETIMKFLEELIKKTEGMSGFQLIAFIFFNNLEASFLGMILGVIFGIFPAVSILINGYILGFVSALTSSSESLSSLFLLLPHGIFELPAVFISLGMGLKLGSFAFQEDKAESFRYFLRNSLRVFLLIVLPLLFIAAIIEGILISL